MPIEKGFILLARAIDESEIMIKPPHFREVWLYLLRNANHTDRVIYGKKLKRGQLLTSYKAIIQALRWEHGSYTKNNIQCAFRHLKESAMITTQKSTRGVIVTICKYDYYQDADNYKVHTEIHMGIQTESTASPHHKQELKNERSFLEKTNLEIEEIKKIFRKKAKEMGKRLKLDDPDNFVAYYQLKGFKIEGKPVKDWDAASIYWLTKEKSRNEKPAAAKN